MNDVCEKELLEDASRGLGAGANIVGCMLYEFSTSTKTQRRNTDFTFILHLWLS